MNQEASSRVSHQTLRDILENQWFEANESPFLLIYDKSAVLTPFFQQKQTQPLNKRIKILSIRADIHPTEFLDRLEIVKDFNETEGWYNHQWIVLIYGESAGQISAFNSFFYYEMLANIQKKVLIFDSFSDLLMHPDVNLVKTSITESLTDRIPSFNAELFSTLLDVPIESYIDENQNLNEWAVWLLVFTANLQLNPKNDHESPAWLSILHEKSPISAGNILLEIIYRLNPSNFPAFEELTAKNLNRFLKEFILSLKLPDLSVTDNFQDDLTKLLQFILQYAKVKGSKKKTTGKTTQGKLDLMAKAKVLQLSTQAQETLGTIVYEWLNNNDNILMQRFQQWTTILRNKQTFPVIKNKEIDAYLDENAEIFSYTGLMDIILTTKVLELQGSSPETKEVWIEKIQKIRKKREALWKEQARIWWQEKPLIVMGSGDTAISINQLWQLTEESGVVIAISKNESTKWSELSQDAWDLEHIMIDLAQEPVQTILKSQECFSSLQKIHHRTIDLYTTIRNKMNTAFTQFYTTQLKTMGDTKSVLSMKKIWQEITKKVKNGGKLGFLFCDAMRQDVALEIRQFITKTHEMQENSIKQHAIENIPTLSLLPSITNIGWNRFLTPEKQLFVKISGENLVSGVQEKTEKAEKLEKILLNNPTDRINAFKQLFQELGCEIKPFELTFGDFDLQKSQLRQRLKKPPPVIPVMFYDKIDNHDLSFEDFLNKYPTYIQEISQIVIKLHTLGIDTIYLITDHGFLFVNEADILSEIPQGFIHKRYCVSPNVFTEEEKQKYANWTIFPLDAFGFLPDNDKNPIRTLVIPKDYRLFKKWRKNPIFYVHGGLTYQECDLLYLKSECILKPEVQLESIDVVENERLSASSGTDMYILKELEKGESKYLQIQLITRKKENSSENLRPLTIRVTCEDPKLKTDMEQEISLNSGQKRNVKIIFPKDYQVPMVEILIKNGENEIIEKKTIHVCQPVVGDLF